MFNKLKGNILFNVLLKRHDINRAYKMVGPEDSWYDTITKVHNSLAEIKKLPHEDVEIISEDNLKLKGLFYPSESSDITVIWVHGYTSHAERESAFPGLFYHSLGYNFLIPYLRAHGPSEGKYISFGALDYLDIIKWCDLINKRIPNGKIIIHGLSMGGGIVLDLIDKEIKNVKCLIADAPSISIEGFFNAVAHSAFKKDGDEVYKHCVNKFNKTFKTDISKFDGFKTIANAKYPLLLSAGENEHMDDLLNGLQKISPKETEIIILPGCNHGNGMYKQTNLYQSVIKKFISKYV
ncbi:MAG: hypothetical protein E7177_06670 [Erysipelotrichaceae bacterium]|nr:hypothetical protein [Erysipelotrichaceae bacterium]